MSLRQRQIMLQRRVVESQRCSLTPAYVHLQHNHYRRVVDGRVANLKLTIAALGGAASLIAGNNGVFGQIKDIKKKSADRRKSKEEVKNLDIFYPRLLLSLYNGI